MHHCYSSRSTCTERGQSTSQCLVVRMLLVKLEWSFGVVLYPGKLLVHIYCYKSCWTLHSDVVSKKNNEVGMFSLEYLNGWTSFWFHLTHVGLQTLWFISAFHFSMTYVWLQGHWSPWTDDLGINISYDAMLTGIINSIPDLWNWWFEDMYQLLSCKELCGIIKWKFQSERNMWKTLDFGLLKWTATGTATNKDCMITNWMPHEN